MITFKPSGTTPNYYVYLNGRHVDALIKPHDDPHGDYLLFKDNILWSMKDRNIIDDMLKKLNKTEIIERSNLPEDYSEMMKLESHHNHRIVLIDDVFRWEEDRFVRDLIEDISLNDLCPLLCRLGFGKNSEVYRKLYRSMGYSLGGYWEVFYWQMNNEDCHDYEQPRE